MTEGAAVGLAVLAAGRGERLGGATPKPLLPLQGRPLLAWSLDAAMASSLRPVVLVVGHRASQVVGAAPQGVLVTRARGWRRGAARSLRAALDFLEPYAQVGAACVGLADQPLVGAGAYERLVAAYRDGATFAVATYGGQRANPVLLSRALWPDARALDGDVGARALMADHDVVDVDCTGTGDPADVDTLDDLRTIEASLEG